jgi:hypothetical protein
LLITVALLPTFDLLTSTFFSTGYWLLATGYWLLATGNWQLATGYWLLATGYCHTFLPFANWLLPFCFIFAPLKVPVKRINRELRENRRHYPML